MSNLDDVSKINETQNHTVFGDGLMLPNMDKSDGNRGLMAIGALAQMLILDNPEKPKVFSRFENTISHYGNIIEKAENDLYVFKIIPMNKYRNIYICQDKITKKIIKIDANAGQNFTEKYGHVWVNEINKYKEKDTIPKGTILKRAKCFDEHGNYMYGVNLKAMYMPWEGMTYEDPFFISRSAATNKLRHTYYYYVDVPINSNDIPKNVHGIKGETYKGFPDIGEEITDGILMAIHRINYDNISEASDKNLHRVLPTDDVYKAKGTVVDIEVFSNLKDEGILDYTYLEQVKKYKDYNETKKFNYIKLIKTLKDKDYKLSDDLNYDLAKYKWAENADWSYGDNNFDTLMMRFTIKHSQVGLIGTKITSRYGDKGVISHIAKESTGENIDFDGLGEIPDHLIIEDSKMPVCPDGTKVEIIINPGAVYNRLIPSTLYEHEINFTSDRYIQLLERNKELSNVDKLNQYIDNYLCLLNTNQSKFLSELDDSDKDELWKEMVVDGLCINQNPFHDNVTPQNLHKIYSFLEAEYEKIGEELLYRIKGINEPVIVADKYFIKLKHETITKMSARNAGNISTMKSIPHKNNMAFKRGLEWFSNNPVRFQITKAHVKFV